MLKSANKPYDKIFGTAQLTRHVKACKQYRSVKKNVKACECE